MANLSFRMTSLITAAVLFLALGTFTSVTIQGGYEVLIVLPLFYFTYVSFGRSFRLPPSAWWFLAFSAVALLTVILNWDIIPKPSKNLGRIKYFLFGALGIFPFGAWLNTVSDQTKRRLARCACTSVIVAAGWVSYQRFFLNLGTAEPLTETMRYAYGTALVGVLALGLAAHAEKVSAWCERRWIWGVIVAAIFALYVINSRGPQAGFLLAIPLVVWFRSRKWAVIVGVIGLILGSFIIWNYIYGSHSGGNLSILRSSSNNPNLRIFWTFDNESDQIRRSQWMAGAIAWKERPWLGWGFSNFSSQLRRIKNQYDLPAKHYDDAHSHNVPLEIATGTGVIGLMLFLTGFFCWVRECWLCGGMVRALMMPFFATLAFEAQFEVILDANNATMLTFIYAVSTAVNKNYRPIF
jgi:O-antigen ligase